MVHQTVPFAGNTTVSTLLLTMSPQENGQKLICRVSNHQLPGSTWDDSVMLNVLRKSLVFALIARSLARSSSTKLFLMSY